ncbi:MAG: threonine-phosphate decarboxylase CobD [Cyanobacteria bacterium J06649_4]
MDRPVHGGNLVWAAGLAGCTSGELLDFSASISPLGPPLSVSEAIRAAFSSVRNYPDTGYGALRSAIASYHHIPIDYILPGNGAAELLTWAARDLASRCQQTLRLVPGFSDYDRALRSFHAQTTDVNLLIDSEWHLQPWRRLATEFTDKDSKRCGFLLNNPHNPTGALFSREMVRAVSDQFALVIVDEAFMDFLPAAREQSVIDWVCDCPNLVVLRSLTKFYSMPGIRLGYAVAQPDTIRRWQQWRDAWPVNTFAAAAGVAALQDTDFQRQTWDWLNAENAYLYEGLSALPGLRPLPSCANFFLVNCRVSATALQALLLKRDRIYIRDCISFSQLGDAYFRVAVKRRTDNQRLLDALSALLPELEEVHSFARI